VGRLTALSPITWQDGWPYFGLPGNLGRTPRTWVKPNTGAVEKPHAPYRRSDDFSAATLQPVWQWNHVPVAGAWSLSERPGSLRLHPQPATSLWDARNTLTQRAIGPRSTVTTVVDASGLKPGDVAGLALFNRPFTWIAVRRDGDGFALAHFDEQSGTTSGNSLAGPRVWLRAECDFLANLATYSFSTDGKSFQKASQAIPLPYGLITFQGIRYSLFAYHSGAGPAGFADFDSFNVSEPEKPGIPYRRTIRLTLAGKPDAVKINTQEKFTVVDRGLGRVALQSKAGCVSVAADGSVALKPGRPSAAETFQWSHTLAGELTLLSLSTNRYLRVDLSSGALRADSPGPRPDNLDGTRFEWR